MENSYQAYNILVRIVKAKYLDNNTDNFFKVRKSSTVSFAWKSILNKINFIKGGLQKDPR